MSNTPIYLAAVGCGGRLRQVITALLQSIPHPVVIRVFDPDARAIERARKEWSGATIIKCKTFQEALDDSKVKWALVGSINSLHREHVVMAFEAGKNVFAEKPLAITFEDCIAIRDAWLTSGKAFFFGLVLRYAPLYRQIFEASRLTQIGKIISFEFNETLRFNHGGFIHGNWRRYRRFAGSFILEKCCHDIDIAQWLVGSLPIKVSSFGGLNFFKNENRDVAGKLGKNSDGKAAYQVWPDPNPQDPFDGKQEIIDNQVVILEYANGVRATFHTNCNAALHERRFYIMGAEGAVRADASTGLIEFQRIGFDAEVQKTLVNIKEDHQGGHAGGDAVMTQHLAESILHGKAPLAGMREALQSAITCFAIERAMEEDCIVDLRPLWNEADIQYGVHQNQHVLASQ